MHLSLGTEDTFHEPVKQNLHHVSSIIRVNLQIYIILVTPEAIIYLLLLH